MPSSELSTPPADGDGRRTSRRLFLGATGLAVGTALSGLAGCLDGREPSDPEAVGAVEASLDALGTVEGYTGAVGGSVDDDTVYERCPFSHYVSIEEAWYPAETGVNWSDATLLGGQSVLPEFSEVRDRGTEALDGREARVIEFAPDTEEFDRYQRRTSVTDANAASPSDVTVTQWLVDDLPTRIQSAAERSSAGTTIHEDVRYDLTYGPVSIELPPIVDDRDACPEP